MTSASSYTANNITVLKGLEAVRKRPGMYIGSTGPDGLHHLVYEVVDNSIDEAMAGHCDRILVVLEKNDIVRVEDNGRGIPCDIHPGEGVSALELVLTRLHAGGKFDKGTYKVSGGLHGVGVSVVNALSVWTEAYVAYNGFNHYQKYETGIPVAPVEKREETDKRGTTIRWLADSTIFTETTTYNFDVLANRLRELAFLNRITSYNVCYTKLLRMCCVKPNREASSCSTPPTARMKFGINCLSRSNRALSIKNCVSM